MARSSAAHPPSSPAVAVAIATYNGAQYLPEQLASLLSQTLLPAEIVICDDQSTDDTAAIVKAFAATAPMPVYFHINPQRLGVVQNFGYAASLCTAPYIAFCDQDDQWLPNRLALTAQGLQALENRYGPQTPLLVYTDVTVTDTYLQTLHPSLLALNALPAWVRRRWPRLALMLSNTAPGNTMLFNHALRARALPIPVSALMHDHWLALVALCHGHAQALPQATLLYRQHSRNQVGAAKHTQNAFQRLRKTLAAKLRQASAAQQR